MGIIHSLSFPHLHESGSEIHIASILPAMMSIQWGGERIPLVSLKCRTQNEVVGRCMCVRNIHTKGERLTSGRMQRDSQVVPQILSS